MNRVEWFDKEISREMEVATSDNKYLKGIVTVRIGSKDYELDLFKIPSEPLMYVDAVSIANILGPISALWRFRKDNIVSKVEYNGKTIGLITRSQALKALKRKLSEDEAVQIRMQISEMRTDMDTEMFLRLMNCSLDIFNGMIDMAQNKNKSIEELILNFMEDYKCLLDKKEPGLFERKWREYINLIKTYMPVTK